MDLDTLQKQAQECLGEVSNLAEIEKFYRDFLGKQGEIAKFFELLKTFSETERRALGQQANGLKNELQALYENKLKILKEKAKATFVALDITRPGKKQETGHLHLITQTQKELTGIFETMGFEIALGPEVETEWYNFDALNVPKDHPARDMQDTFWLKPGQKLLRTHTSPVQARYMETHKPPFRIVVPGRVFRNEATDSKHEAQFYQLEGLMVGKDISVANFKAIITEFLSQYFSSRVEIRLRPGYFPFVEPGFEIDAKQSNGGWIELMGAGMAHPNVLKAANIDPTKWQGFAFGMGIERLAMIKHKIPDLRLFYQSDLRFLKQF